MRKLTLILTLLCIEKSLHAQQPYVYTIKADSVKITNTCDTAELIIENHTQNVPGFLFNKGRGRTEFRRGLQKITDSLYLVGGDSLKINPWLQGGNTFGKTGILGTRDNNHLDFYTNNIKRGRLDSIGRFSLDYTANQTYDAFSLTTGNGTKKWFNIQGAALNSSISMSTNNDNAGALECMRLTAGGQASTIETFAYSDLSVKGWAGLDLYGGYGGGSSKYIRFFPAATLAGSFMSNGNFVLGNTTTDNGNKLQVNGTTYSQFYTNAGVPLGTPGGGALKLRWGGGEGTYFDFYYQNNTNRRGIMGTAADNRPLYISDSVGFSFLNTPYVALGFEQAAGLNSRLAIVSQRASGWDGFSIWGITSAGMERDFTVRASGNAVVGDGGDNGNKLQVYGKSSFSDEVYAGNDSYVIQLKPAYGNGYGTGIDASMIAFGNIRAAIGMNKQNKGNIPANSLLIGGTSPGYWTSMIDYNGNPTVVTTGEGSVTINGGYNGINLGGSAGYSPNANSYPFNILGGRGTGSGAPGDINFYTGNAQPSGTTIHTMTTRWTIKGGTGYLSNSANPTSVVDVSGTTGYSQFRLRTSYTPASTSDTNGNVGDFSWDDNYFYIKTSAGWKRSALTTF